jgi:hypothetical protein
MNPLEAFGSSTPKYGSELYLEVGGAPGPQGRVGDRFVGRAPIVATARSPFLVAESSRLQCAYANRFQPRGALAKGVPRSGLRGRRS